MTTELILKESKLFLLEKKKKEDKWLVWMSKVTFKQSKLPREVILQNWQSNCKQFFPQVYTTPIEIRTELA